MHAPLPPLDTHSQHVSDVWRHVLRPSSMGGCLNVSSGIGHVFNASHLWGQASVIDLGALSHPFFVEDMEIAIGNLVREF